MSAVLGPLEYGGPDLPARRLRDLLQAQVDASPPGSRIDWATYYFRDRALAEALIRASDRGVHINLVLEPDPRRAGANDAVIAMLRRHGLNGGFHIYRSWRSEKGHLHAKIYGFSHPDICWIGSFNPSGDEPEDAEVVGEIGDQDRGHNLLLPVRSAKLTAALRGHVGRLAGWSPVPPVLRPAFNRIVKDGGTRLYFYPRLRPYLVERSIARLQAGDRVQAAISHLKAGELTGQLAGAVSRGVTVNLLVHDTVRRVPSELVEQLTSDGVRVVRVVHKDGLPMHAKFILIEQRDNRAAWLGSYNFNKKSRRHNAEVLLRTDDPSTFASLQDRFEVISSMGTP
ncbi:MAG: phospholipase D-like domain-containing protein [Pseudomonadota bacterium]|nr:phospholipase D-like domain-containing protein [Pseudomonadota bacterium]